MPNALNAAGAVGDDPACQPALAGIHVGISGWNYPVWRRGFYANVRQRDWLAHCTRRFTGLEVNATFFRFIKPEIVASWRDAAPHGFCFALKGHRFVTHGRRLRDVGGLIQRMRATAQPLGRHLGAVLWLLPPGLSRDLGLLADFARMLGDWPEARHVVEFRHHSWMDDRVAAMMAENHLAVCRAEGSEWPAWRVQTTNLAYVRLYGLVGRNGRWNLDEWRDLVRRWRSEGREVHLYFEAEGNDDAPYEALDLIGRLRSGA